MLFLNVRHDKIQSQYNDKEITTEWLRLRFVCCVFDMCWVVICIYCCPDPEWRESTGPFYFLIPDIEWYRMQLLSWWSLLCWLDSASPVNDANLKLYQPNGELFRFICYHTRQILGIMFKLVWKFTFNKQWHSATSQISFFFLTC